MDPDILVFLHHGPPPIAWFSPGISFYLLHSDGKCWICLKADDGRRKTCTNSENNLRMFPEGFWNHSFQTVTNRQLSKGGVGVEHVDFKDTVARETSFSERKSAVKSATHALVNTCLELLFSWGPVKVEYIVQHPRRIWQPREGLLSSSKSLYYTASLLKERLLYI